MIQNIPLATMHSDIFKEIAGHCSLITLSRLRLTNKSIKASVERVKICFAKETFATYRQNELAKELLKKTRTLDDEAFQQFEEFDNFKELSRLDVPEKPLCPSFMPKLISLWPNLKVFKTYNSELTIQDIQQLTSLTALEVLKIEQPKATPEQLANLVSALPSLQIIDMSGKHVNSQTLKALRKKIAGLTNLEQLILNPFNWKKKRPVIGHKELIKFANAAKVLTNLKTLRLRGVKPSDALTQEFAKNLPKGCKITFYLNET